MLAKQLHMYQVHQENCFVCTYLVELLAIILSPRLNSKTQGAKGNIGFKFIWGVLFLSPYKQKSMSYFYYSSMTKIIFFTLKIKSTLNTQDGD